jgi:hypothetical protein
MPTSTSSSGSSMRNAREETRAFFARNWVLKVAALGIAMLLWFSVRFESRDQQEIRNVLVEVALTDADWVLVQDESPLPRATVRFRGPAFELLRLSNDRPTLVIPLSNVSAPDTTLTLQPGWVRFGDRPGVSVESVQPSQVRLTFERVQRIALPPAIRLEGELPDGLALAAMPEPSVGTIRVVGPRSRTLPLDSVPLRPVDLTLITQSGVITVPVDLTELAGLQVEPTSVAVTFEVEPRGMRVLRRPLLPPPLALRGFPAEVDVELSGAASVLERVSPVSVRVVPIFPDEIPAEGEFELTFRVDGLSPLIRSQVAPIRVRREDG